MDPTPEQKLNAIWAFLPFWLQQIRELHARSESMRVLLIQRGVFSQDEFDQAYAQILAKMDESFDASLKAVATDITIQRLYEMTKGTPQ